MKPASAIEAPLSIFGETRTESTQETLELGACLGKLLSPGDVVLLFGELGAGKTVVAKGIASALGVAISSIISPSFTLMNVHEGSIRLIHLDLYRIDTLAQAEQVGLLDVFDAGAIVVVEWPEKILEVCETIPHIKVFINVPEPGTRLIRLSDHR